MYISTFITILLLKLRNIYEFKKVPWTSKHLHLISRLFGNHRCPLVYIVLRKLIFHIVKNHLASDGKKKLKQNVKVLEDEIPEWK